MKRAFTLIEVFIVVVIFSVVILTIYGIFQGGLNICQRIKNISFSEEKIVLFLERLSQNLRQAYDCKQEELKFKGMPKQIVFVAFSKNPPGLNQYDCKFSEEEGKLILTYQSIESILEEREEEKVVKELANLDDFKLTYIGFDKKSAELIETDTWEQDYLPAEIKIEAKLTSRKKISTPVHVYVADKDKKQAIGYESRDSFKEDVQIFTSRVFLYDY